MKDKERDIFDDLFRSKLQDFEADTMPGDWEAIADRLPVKKSIAEKIFYSTITKVEERTNEKGLEIFQKALTNATPLLEVKARRIGGSTYQVPIDVKPDRGFALASSWIIAAAKNRGGKSFVEKLTNELIDASNGNGAACKKREDTHRMAEANKAFAHYRY